MRLQPNTVAPSFKATTIDGTEVALSDYRGQRVWLSFFRYAACPLCSFRIHELLTQWTTAFVPRQIHLLTVWQSKPEKLQEIVDRYAPPFSLITDPEMELYRLFEVEEGMLKAFGKEVFTGMNNARKAKIPLVRGWEGSPSRRPADFLINGEGVIEVAHYGENVGQMIPLEDAVAWANATA